MSEFFIVLSRPVQEFDDLAAAQAHQQSLTRHVPDAEHKVYRCKRWLVGAAHFPKMVQLLVDIQREGLNDVNRNWLRIILLTVGNRSPKLQSLTRAPGPAEYQPPPGGRTGA